MSNYYYRTGVIYSISDPDTGEIVYIGRTIGNSYSVRQQQHMSSQKTTPIGKWITEKKLEGKVPKFDIVHKCDEHCERGEFEYMEYYYITTYMQQGVKLLNSNISYYEKPECTYEMLKSGKYNNAWIAVRLYPEIGKRSAISKLHNKVNRVDGRFLTFDEKCRIKEIIKKD